MPELVLKTTAHVAVAYSNTPLGYKISASFKIVPLRDVDCVGEPQAWPRVSIIEPLKEEKKESCF